MALELDATLGGATANTYLTLAEAETYFEKRLHSDDWDDATDAQKNEALAMSARMIDGMYDFVGTIMTTTQALRWPRGNVYDIDGRYLTPTEIPSPIANAQCEQALYLLSTDPTALPAILSQGIKRAKIGPLEVEASMSFQPKQMAPNTTWAVGSLGSLRNSSISLRRA